MGLLASWRFARLAICAFVGWIGFGGPPVWRAQAQQVMGADKKDTLIIVEWHLAKKDAGQFKAKYKLQEPSPFETRNPVVLGEVALVGGFFVQRIVDALLDLVRKHKNDGFSLDVRSDKLVVERAGFASPGNIVVIGRDGVERVRLSGSNPEIEPLTDALNWAVLHRAAN